MIKALLPKELQQLHKMLPEQGKFQLQMFEHLNRLLTDLNNDR